MTGESFIGTRLVFRPTTVHQCWAFIVGSALFALGAAPRFAALVGASNANLMFFVGSWFFTAAGLMQLALAGPRVSGETEADGAVHGIRADWLAAATQSFGTVLFNISTGAAVDLHTPGEERDLVWSPNAAGSVAFLISGVVAIVAYGHTAGWWRPRSLQWWSVTINLAGSVLFGVSAVGAYVLPSGLTEDIVLTNLGTCLGAVCFLLCSAIVLPGAVREQRMVPA